MTPCASPADDVAAKVRSILSDAEKLEALSRTNPHAFFEGKDGLVRALKELHANVRDGDVKARDRGNARGNSFTPGKIAGRNGRIVVAEIRRARRIEQRKSA